jgi:hypothetical protein
VSELPQRGIPLRSIESVRDIKSRELATSKSIGEVLDYTEPVIVGDEIRWDVVHNDGRISNRRLNYMRMCICD